MEPAPNRSCVACGDALKRKLFPCGRLETTAQFGHRKYCNRTCAATAISSHPGVRATARKVGISAAHVSRVFAGKRGSSPDIARRISEACGMSLQALVDLMDRGRPKPS